MSLLTIQQITNQALSVLENSFQGQYRVRYVMKPLYGKYIIFKHVGSQSTTVAKGLDKTTAEGMMKLLTGVERDLDEARRNE